MDNMYFLLGFWANIKNEIGIAADGLMRGIFYSICSLVYKMINRFYSVFEVLCNAQLLESSELNRLFGRISLLLGVVMLFRVAFSFIQAIIDPDTITDKEKGLTKIAGKVVVVIIMFGFSGYVFDLAATLQSAIIKENVIPRFLLPQQVDTEKFGGSLAANLFTTFYNINPSVEASSFGGSSTTEGYCVSDDYIETLRTNIIERNDFSYKKSQCLSVTGVYKDEDGTVTNEDVYVIEFNYIFCLAVGIAVLWFLVNYCISVGVRIIQLTVLQLISPIAFIGYLEPKSDNIFKKWLKIYISTYIDVFIRMGIISFVCYICALIMEGWNDGTGVFWRSVGNPEGLTAKIIGIFMILALFKFAKNAPGLIEGIFSKSASGIGFGVNKENFKPLRTGARFAGGAAAVTLGGAGFAIASGVGRYRDAKQYKVDEEGKPIKGSAALAALGGVGSGLVRGFRYGTKKGNIIDNMKTGFKEQTATDDKYRDLIAKGGSRMGQIKARATNLFGSDRGSADDILLRNASRVEDALKTFSEQAEATQTYQDLMKEVTGLYNQGKNAEAAAVKDLANKWKEEYIARSIKGDLSTDTEIEVKANYEYKDKNGQTVQATLERKIKASGGDIQRGNGFHSTYVELMSEMNNIKTETVGNGKTYIDENGNEFVSQYAVIPGAGPNGSDLEVKDFRMVDPSQVDWDTIDRLLKAARYTKDNVRQREGFRAGQANKPEGSGKNNS